MSIAAHNDAIAYFLSFCIELYKNAHSISGEEASRILGDSGALEFLAANHEVIHTQSPQWILEEIEEYLSA
ncbi:MAG: DUF3791 domain-containing protein [Muribaculaceae bacterium]|nr:DUF3791 domain-containing protein [Muribaculaceae bacterium]